MGPFAEVEMVLDAQNPSDFTERLQAIRTVSASNNAQMDEMSSNRADMAYTEQRLTALRQVAQEKKEAAEARLREAQEAAEGARAAKEIVDGLIAQEEAALGAAQENRADVKAQYEELAKEQERIQREIAEAAAKLESSTGMQDQWRRQRRSTAVPSGTSRCPATRSVPTPAGGCIRSCTTSAATRVRISAHPSGTPIHAVESGT